MLNSALRSGDGAELKRLEPYIKVATSGLNQLPPHKGVVFRGVDLPPEAVAKYEPGKLVIEPHFTSTSVAKDAAFPGNTEFVIRSSNGKDVSILSEFPGEKEVFFAPGTQFKVLSVDADSANGVRRINMYEVTKGGSSK